MNAPPVSLALELSNVGLVRGETVILDDISWAVSEGERWIVLGANGSGKTSLIRIARSTCIPRRARSTCSVSVSVESMCVATAGASASHPPRSATCSVQG